MIDHVRALLSTNWTADLAAHMGWPASADALTDPRMRIATMRSFLRQQQVLAVDLWSKAPSQWRRFPAPTAHGASRICPRLVVPQGVFLNRKLWIDADVDSGCGCANNFTRVQEWASTRDGVVRVGWRTHRRNASLSDTGALPACRGLGNDHVLRGKRVYMYGDSTMRQMVGAALSLLSGSATDFSVLKKYVRESCRNQEKPDRYPGGCSANERTCHFLTKLVFAQNASDIAAIPEVDLLFDWKHFARSPRDLHVLSRFAHFSEKADIVVVNTGNHDCGHLHSYEHVSDWAQTEEDVRWFMAELRRAVPVTVPVIFLDNSYYGEDNCKSCGLWVNAMVRLLALDYGFHVMSRETVGFAYFEHPGTITEVHLPDHVMEIDMHYLLGTIECLLST
jgi:hypothetical protein